MSADIVSLFPAANHAPRGQGGACTRSTALFEAHVACLMTIGNSLSASLLAGITDPARCLAQFVDDPALLAVLGQHATPDRLYRFLLGYALLDESRTQLWREIEERLHDRPHGG